MQGEPHGRTPKRGLRYVHCEEKRRGGERPWRAGQVDRVRPIVDNVRPQQPAQRDRVCGVNDEGPCHEQPGVRVMVSQGDRSSNVNAASGLKRRLTVWSSCRGTTVSGTARTAAH